MKENVEILLAAYNGERYLAEQIHSIFHQSFPHIQLTIRDDASTDRTHEIIEKQKQIYPHINLITSESNQGLVSNFSALLSQSKAEYIMLSDQDDVWFKDKVAKSFAKMKELECQHGNAIPLLVHTDLAVVNDHLEPICHSFWEYANLHPQNAMSLNRLLTQNTITGCTIMINRKLLEFAAPIPSEVVMHDWWLGLVASAFGKIGVVDEATLLYRQHGSNDTGAKKYGLLAALSEFSKATRRRKILRNHMQRFRQAEAFNAKFEHTFSNEQKDLVQSFLMMEKTSLPHKVMLMVRYDLYKQGLLRNLYEIFN